MSGSTIGTRLVLTSFGESHGRCVGATLDGCPAGLDLDEKDIQPILDRRRPGQSVITTQRREADAVEILSGTFRGVTTGAPITMTIQNEDTRSQDYDQLASNPRPGHSDYPATVKYRGKNDHRGGGRFSGRITATHVMGGAVAIKLLETTLNVKTSSYVSQIGDIVAAPSRVGERAIYGNEVRCPDAAAAESMKRAILSAKRDGDSLGGVITSNTVNLPVGMGEPVFGSIESELARAMFSIPSVKGVEFGSGFAGSKLRGSQNNDPYTIKNGRIQTATNNAGGILGGMTNGMPITMRVAFKPASSIAQEQKTINIDTKRPATIRVKGRHDPCVVPRAPPVVDSLVALVLADQAIVSHMIGPVI